MATQGALEPSFLQTAANLREFEAGLWVGASEATAAFGADMHDACLQLEETSFWFRHRNRCICEAVRRNPPLGTIVDVGGGNGAVTRALREEGWSAVVLEPGQAGARNALRRGLAPVIHATLEGAGFRPRTLPAIGLFDVVEHQADDVAFLEGVARALQPMGRVYLTVPAFGALWSHEDERAGHHRRYTTGSLTRALNGAGLAVDFSTYFFTMLPGPIFLLRSVPSRLGRSAVTSASDAHAGGPWWAHRALGRALEAELALLRRGHALPFGASLLAVAHRS